MRRRLGAAAAVCLVVAAVVTGCSGRSTSGYPCQDACRGAIGAAAYSIRTPAHWNGVLLLFSHGYGAKAADLHPFLSPADTSGTGVDALSEYLLGKGYALAGSAFSSPGWDVSDALSDNAALYRRFSAVVGRPTRVIAWGISLGGLVTELETERASWVSGGAALCGAVSGPVLSADLLMRSLVIAQDLTGAQLVAETSSSAATAQSESQAVEATAGIDRLATDTTGGGAAALVVTADLLGLPERSLQTPVTDPTDAARAAAENLTPFVQLAVSILTDLTSRYGAGVADPGMAQVAELSADQAAVVRSLGGDPTTAVSSVRALAPPPVKQSSRAALAASGTPTGRLRAPLLTVHGLDDPVAIPAGERVLQQRVAAAGRSSLLRQVYIAPASNEPDSAYGVGHCVFSAQQQVGAVLAADHWAATGRSPDAATLRADLGRGIDSDYQPPAWPTPTG